MKQKSCEQRVRRMAKRQCVQVAKLRRHHKLSF